jgi:hypothetical protein
MCAAIESGRKSFRPLPQEEMEAGMKLIRSGWRRAVLTAAVMALGTGLGLATAAAPATAATSSSSHISTTATQEMPINSSYDQQALVVEKSSNAGYGKTLILSPWGLHSASMQGGICSASTAHWFTLHINYLGGPTAWIYQCFGGQGTWDFFQNVILWACSGNNIGSFSWFPEFTSGSGSVNYGPGWSKNYPTDSYETADVLTINSWSGSYDCP